jgi:hypothetical protein
MAILKFSKNDFVQLGLQLASNWSNAAIERCSYTTNKGRMNDFYFASPRTLKEIFRDIQHPDLGKFQIKKPSPREFLAAFYFLKKYPTKIDQAGYLGCNEKYGLQKAWKYVESIQALKEKKVSIGGQAKSNSQLGYLTFNCSIDTIHF